jgi:hypothetical protein
VRLVVLDSVAFHYRQDFADLSQRTRILNEASLLLMSLADNFSLAVREQGREGERKREEKSGPGGLTREVETPRPSNHPQLRPGGAMTVEQHTVLQNGVYLLAC